ncbi:chlorinating enzyme [Allokutzneria albata]|uniref:Non-haem Fe2+, alpha-ketoglutarate-dependent halogenase n=1 Tax=Allokutzneria albata TaxID=211114 RepID=A0A1G9Y6I2_ALLAB|nr:chlorinating enzyme [Allokutzneria albata]SDN04667.1 non-haem Fe2+, alpha-ketoglutarate-dependent halogenase [Allokutzneria albata]
MSGNATKVTSDNYRLSASEVEQFKQNGYIGPFTIYTPEQLDELWEKARAEMYDRTHAAYPLDSFDEVAGVTNIANYDRHLDIDFLTDHVMNAKIVDRVASVLGDDVLCWRTEFFPKHAGDEGTDWHQADTFANASGTPQILWPTDDPSFIRGGTVTVWTAFTDTTTETACLQFIPGTHLHMNYDESKPMEYRPDKFNQVEKAGVNRGFYGYDYRELRIDPDFEPDESKAVPIELKRGQCIIFLSTLMHASYPHRGTKKEMRLGFASRYVPTRVRVYPDTEVIEEYGGRVSLDRFGSVLVSGENSYDFNKVVTTNLKGRPFVRRSV